MRTLSLPRRSRIALLAGSVFAALPLIAGPVLAAPGDAAPARIIVDTNAAGVPISPSLFGVFFEEINHAGDGGIYAELIRNRSFEDGNGSADGWTAVDGATLSTDSTKPLNDQNTHALKVVAAQAGAGVAAEGYWGVPAEKGKEYRFSLYARADGAAATGARVCLEDDQGKVLAEQTVSGIGSGWKEFTGSLKSAGTDAKARLVVRLSQPGTMYLDMVSLFPRDTYKGRQNGLRRDLAEKVAALKPGFVRFPGGCFVEGDKLENAFRWKETIVDVAARPGRNNLWGYRSTDGLGFHEYLEWCEDMSAEPLFVINCGMSHSDFVPMDQMQPYVQSALDALEYANGPVTSKWGALRAKNGHPKPFNIRYMEIGNENGGARYNERYALFHDALKAKYPEVKLIACDWGGVPQNRPLDLIDQHLYSSAEGLVKASTRYDSWDRAKSPKVYFGEYAVTSGAGHGNVKAAVGEAAFMTGLERNADIVQMASYAPLFVHTDDRKWNPDAIVFDNARSYGTPSYYVQQMFAANQGDRSLPVKVEATVAPTTLPAGAVGVGTWKTQAEYKDITVTDASGKVIYSSATSAMVPGPSLPPGFKNLNGKWITEDGNVLRQDSDATDVRAVVGDPTWTGDRTITLKARKLGGAEGFLVMFSVRGDDDWYWWNIGGWGNTEHGLEKTIAGGASGTWDRVPGKIDTGRWYDIRIELRGNRIRCFLDGKLIQDVEDATAPTVTASASRNTKTGELLVKVVNFSGDSRQATIALSNGAKLNGKGSVTVLASNDPMDENSLTNPTKIVPTTKALSGIGQGQVNYTCPPYSVSILRIKAGK